MRTHIDQCHDPEGVGHAADAPAPRDGIKTLCGFVIGRVLEEVVIFEGPVGVPGAVVLRQEGLGHQGADERAQANEEMESLQPRQSQRQSAAISRPGFHTSGHQSTFFHLCFRQKSTSNYQGFRRTPRFFENRRHEVPSAAQTG